MKNFLGSLFSKKQSDTARVEKTVIPRIPLRVDTRSFAERVHASNAERKAEQLKGLQRREQERRALKTVMVECQYKYCDAKYSVKEGTVQNFCKASHRHAARSHSYGRVA